MLSTVACSAWPPGPVSHGVEVFPQIGEVVAGVDMTRIGDGEGTPCSLNPEHGPTSAVRVVGAKVAAVSRGLVPVRDDKRRVEDADLCVGRAVEGLEVLVGALRHRLWIADLSRGQTDGDVLELAGRVPEGVGGQREGVERSAWAPAWSCDELVNEFGQMPKMLTPWGIEQGGGVSRGAASNPADSKPASSEAEAEQPGLCGQGMHGCRSSLRLIVLTAPLTRRDAGGR